ncbi:hypothetical protein H0G86_011856 [Trichoderma simmonsii]|uniref:Uncharacterized protein n=1 Tax=Trichoderma simmonsii TaxID=1491479 RepID=A0A8G0LQ89_9HYPO|nr:hypothetical protein H0G86_011856 [Trichoderma simmonsii]
MKSPSAVSRLSSASPAYEESEEEERILIGMETTQRTPFEGYLPTCTAGVNFSNSYVPIVDNSEGISNELKPDNELEPGNELKLDNELESNNKAKLNKENKLDCEILSDDQLESNNKFKLDSETKPDNENETGNKPELNNGTNVSKTFDDFLASKAITGRDEDQASGETKVQYDDQKNTFHSHTTNPSNRKRERQEDTDLQPPKRRCSASSISASIALAQKQVDCSCDPTDIIYEVDDRNEGTVYYYTGRLKCKECISDKSLARYKESLPNSAACI